MALVTEGLASCTMAPSVPSMPAMDRIRVQLPRHERVWVEKQAHHDGRTVSAYVRRLIRSHMELEPHTDRAAKA